MGPHTSTLPASRPALPAVVVVVLALAGCGPARGPAAPAAGGGTVGEEVRVMPAVSEEVREQLLDGAVAVIDRLEDYDEESAFAQVFDRLNQWSHAAGAAGFKGVDGWRVDPLFAGLPARLREGVSPDSLESSVFDAATDVVWLRDQRWLADVAATARGDAVSDVDIAVNLFRWTVRSLALVSDPPMVPTDAASGSRWFLPGEILLSGRASPAQRSWVFLELLRHAGLDGVMLATGQRDGGGMRAWIPALISGGEAWLFEPTYGIPIAGPDGTGVATARQAAADPAILERLSVPERRYPVQAADVAGLSVLVAADPWSLSRRMKAVESQLVGSRAIELSLDAAGLAERAVRAIDVGGAAEAAAGRIALWEFPWDTIARRRIDPARVRAAAGDELAVMSVTLAQSTGSDREGGRRGTRLVRPLYAARLREFRGQLDGPEGAKVSYLAARPGRQAIADAVAQAAPEQVDRLKRLFERMKEDATYWLGTLTLAEGEYEAAVDYLGRMILEASPDSRWADAARVNLARAYVGLGRPDEATRMLRADESPQRFGSRMLAEELQKAAK